MGKTVTVHFAKTNLSRLLAEVEKGNTVVVARRHKPVAKLVPAGVRVKRQFGALRGVGSLSAEEAFAPLPAEELAAWEK